MVISKPSRLNGELPSLVWHLHSKSAPLIRPPAPVQSAESGKAAKTPAAALKYLNFHCSLFWRAATAESSVVQHRLCTCLHLGHALFKKFFYLPVSPQQPYSGILFLHFVLFSSRNLSSFVFPAGAVGSCVSGWNVLIGVVAVRLPSAPHHFSLAPWCRLWDSVHQDSPFESVAQSGRVNSGYIIVFFVFK